MKNKRLLIFCAVVSVAMHVSAQNADEAKKLKLGFGLSSYSVGGGIGANVKLDYLKNSKLSFGLNAMFSTNSSFQDYTSQSNNNSKGFTVDHKTGSANAICLSANYHLIGDNTPNSKFGLYIGSGLSFSSWNAFETVTSLAPKTDSAYYVYEDFFGENQFSIVGTIGLDYRIGKGKINLELVNNFGLLGTAYDNYNNIVPSLKNGLIQSAKVKHTLAFGNIPFINFGYQLYLK